MTLLSFLEFFAKYNGKSVDVDGFAGAQCVDLMRKYCEEVLKIGLYAVPALGTDGGAGDIYNKVGSNHKQLQRFYNWPWAVPKQGDIMLFARSKTLPYGHVAIFNEGNAKRFTSFDQNWGSDKRSRLVEHNYSGVQGWLRKR